MADDLKGALADVDTTKSALDASYAKLRGEAPVAPQANKKWTVRLSTGEIYHGVQAPTQEAAIAKMRQGPQGPLAPKPGESAAPADELKQATQEYMGVTGAPRSGREAAGMLVPAAVGALVPSGRTFPRIAGQVLGNVLGRGVTEGVGEAVSPTGEGAITAGLRGAMKGVLPGLVQGGLGAAFGAKGDTLRVQKAAEAVKKAPISKEVAAFIDPSKPGSLLSRRTWQKMQAAASRKLDEMEAMVEKKLGPKVLFPHVEGNVASQAPFASVRAKIKELRSLGEGAYSQDPTTSKVARESKIAAARLEDSMLRQMRASGHQEAADTYEKALRQYANDKNAIRYVQGVQQRNKIAGGVNPQDQPELAQAEKSLAKTGLGTRAVHGAIGAAEAATGRGMGATYHLGRALGGKPSPLRPQETVPSITRSRLPGVLGGIGANVGQQALGQTAPFQRSTGE